MDQRDYRGKSLHSSNHKLGIVLPGGGARGAYQVGVLAGISELFPPNIPTPFRIVSGTSAGAMTAAYLAGRMVNFRDACDRLVSLWSNLQSDQVFVVHYRKMLQVVLRWMWAFMVGGLGGANPKSLFDNRPLANLLKENINFSGIQEAIEHELLEGLAITVTGYSSERSFTYYQATPHVQPWWRERREGRPCKISLSHIMASLALPVMFPAVKIDGEWCSDGSIRGDNPLSPAIHLGAERLLVVDTRYVGSRNQRGHREASYPSVSDIAAFTLDTLFSDSLYADLERAERINRTLDHLRPGAIDSEAPSLRALDTYLLAPSQPPTRFLEQHIDEVPRAIRWLMKTLGNGEQEGGQLLSYLMFEGMYARELIALGKKDVLEQADGLRAFLGLDTAHTRRVD